jgi:hypothetical protein
MRILFCGAIISVILAIAGCTFTPRPTATQTRTPVPSATLPTPTRISSTANPTPNPIAYPTHLQGVESIRCPYPPCWYTKTPLPAHTRTPTPTPVDRPGEPLDRTSAESVLEWLNYSLSEPDMSFFECLALPEIVYGPAYSEGTGTYSKDEFLEQVRQRISVRPRINAYNVHLGEINTLFVITWDWFPAWDFEDSAGKLVSNCVVLDFSDQWTKGEGLSLHGVYTTLCFGFMETPFP